MLNILIDFLHRQPLVLAVIVLGIFYYTVKYFQRDTTHKFPPGPMGIPFFGYFPNLSNQPYYMLDKLSKEYGEIFSIRVAGRQRIILNSYDAIKSSFIADGNNFQDRPNEFSVIGSLFNFKSLVNGEEWKSQRKILTAALTFLSRETSGGTSVLEIRISESARKMVERIRDFNSKPADLYSIFANSTMDAVGCLVCGESLATTQPKIARRILEDTRAGFSKIPPAGCFMFGALGELISKLFTNKQKEIKEVWERQFSIMKKFIQEHEVTFDPENIRDYIDTYLNEKFKFEKMNPGVDWFSLESLSANLFLFFVGATDSTATTVYYAIFLMAKYPEVQKKCQEELAEFASWNGSATYRDRKQLPYIEAVLNEVLRYAILAPTPTPRCSTRDTNILGYYIPAKSYVSVNLWTVTRDPKLWPFPNEFNPMNFYERNVPRDLTSFGFSAGRRQCPGESLARLELFSFFTSILQEFNISIPPGQNLKEEILPGFTRMLVPFKVIASPR